MTEGVPENVREMLVKLRASSHYLLDLINDILDMSRLDSGMLEQLTEEAWYSPFPQFQTTERPDRAAQELLNGKAVLLCDNSPVALVVPGAFNSFMESSEDWYNRFEMASSCGFSGIWPWLWQRCSPDFIWL